MAMPRFGRFGGFLCSGWVVGRVGVAEANTTKLWACGACSTHTVKVAGLEPAPDPLSTWDKSLFSGEKSNIFSEVSNIRSGQNGHF